MRSDPVRCSMLNTVAYGDRIRQETEYLMCFRLSSGVSIGVLDRNTPYSAFHTYVLIVA